MTTLAQTTASRLYDTLRADGRGESIEVDGIEHDDRDAAVTALVADGGAVVITADTTDEVTVVAHGARLLAIGCDGDGSGAWACDIAPTTEQLEALRDDAGQAGDFLQVALCCRALDDEHHLAECAASDEDKATVRAMSAAAALAAIVESLAD